MLTLVLLATVLTIQGGRAEGLTYGIVAKSVSDRNFVDTWEGCNRAAERWGDRCALIGNDGPAQAREHANVDSP
ncbi:hypothetical protein GCM10022278_37420 [Allohahella marinimesophila]|uniref:DUF4189 domain-containing protein n=1 Tax=Allohahella marinimesophila TaxID=1054972 RepID=A0ABP7Q6I6_9GAMM